jgi:hypothetical protein
MAPKGRAADAPPAALTLVSATYDIETESVILAFDRAVDAAAYDPAAITVQDGVYAGGLFVGSGPATVINPTTIQVFLEQIGSPTVSDVELSATAATGIVATDDGGTWAGVTNVVLPFP